MTLPQPPAGLDLEAIEAREKAATKGPWTEDDGFIHSEPKARELMARLYTGLDRGGIVTLVAECSQELENFEADADFITQARQDIPALIAEAKRLRSVAEAAGEYVRVMQGYGWSSIEAARGYNDLRHAIDPTIEKGAV